MTFSIKKVITKIPYSAKLYGFFVNDIQQKIYSRRIQEYYNKTFFDRKTISKRKGPVVLISREIAFTFPLSYAYLAGYLKERGIKVVILFKNVSQTELVKKIIKQKPILVGFGNLYPELEEIKNIIFKLNEAGRDFPIVVGGQMFSPIPDFVMRLTGADYGVIGEGEITLYKLVRALQKNTDVYKIGGLVVRDKKVVTINENGKYIEDLSKLPKVPYELFDVKEWLQIGRWYTQYKPEQPHWRFNDRVINVHGGRGCPFRCNFCYHHNIPRYRSIDNMMDEAEKALEKFDANMLYFSDDLVIANPQRVRELINRVKKLKKPINYSISTRFDILEHLDFSLLKELKKTGCRIMGLGIESGSDRMLKLIGKNTTSKKILKELKRLKRAGILPTVSIMVGQYTETKSDVMKSFKLMKQSVRDNPLITYAFTICTPFPGSFLHNLIFQKGLLKTEDEFYSKYLAGRVGDWNQTVNLSKMSDKEVVKMRSNLDKSFYNEKIKAYGKERYDEIMKICRKQTQIAEIFENKTEKEKKKNEFIYSVEQQGLEKRKLALMGIK